MRDAIERGVVMVVRLAALLGGVALVLLTAVIMVDVVGRFFGAPLYGSRDIVQMASVFVVFGGLAYADLKGGHIQVDILADHFPEAMNRILVAAGYALGAVAFGLIAWQLWKAAGFSAMLGAATNLLSIPRAPFQQSAAILSGLTALLMAWRVVTTLDGRGDQERTR